MKELPLHQQFEFWEEVFTRESQKDTPPMTPKETIWSTGSYILPAEVDAALKSSSDNTAGPDGLSLA